MSARQRSRLVTLKPEQVRSFKRIFVVGDLHGDFDTLAAFQSLFNPVDDLAIFLGDYADRGENGVEIIEQVDRLLNLYPENVFALQGNHEVYSDDGAPTFAPCHLVEEATAKRGDWQAFYKQTFQPFVQKLHLALCIEGEALFVHGGVSSQITSLETLRCPTPELIEVLLNSDVATNMAKQEPNRMRGSGIRFGYRPTEDVCQTLGIKRIFRGHQHNLGRNKPGVHHNQRVVTVISSISYSKSPYVVSLDPADLQNGEIIHLNGNRKYPLDFVELERESVYDSIALAPPDLNQKLTSALRKLSELVGRGRLPRASACDPTSLGLARNLPDSTCQRILVSELEPSSTRSLADSRTLVFVFNQCTRRVIEAYYSPREPMPGQLLRLKLP